MKCRALAVVLALVVGCSGSNGTPDAAPGDSGAPDAAAPEDAGNTTDTGHAPDVGAPDAGTDAGLDAATDDAGMDAGTDAGTDAGLDAATHDAAAAVQCGNGVIDPGEQCDPGSSPPANDGCHPPGSGAGVECRFVPAAAGDDRCPGRAIAVPMGTTILPESGGTSTYGFADDYAGSCNTAAAPPGGGLDRVYQVTPAQSGVLTVTVGAQSDGTSSTCAISATAPDCWAAQLYARATCSTASTELACAVGISGTDVVPASISFPVTVGTPYFVFVDGYDDQTYSYGPFNLVLTLH